MIDALVDTTIATYLRGALAASGYPSFTVVRGMEDNVPDLDCPYLVVHSEIERFQGRDHVFELRTTIEMHSLSGINKVTDLETMMSVVDHALLERQNVAVPTPGFVYFGWEGVQRSTLTPGDRRQNLREIQVFSQLS